MGDCGDLGISAQCGCKELHCRLHLVVGQLFSLSLVFSKAANEDDHVEPWWMRRNGS